MAGCKGTGICNWLPWKSLPSNKIVRLKSAFKNFQNEPNIKALSLLGAEIQPFARVVAMEPKFITGCQGIAYLATKL